MKVLSATPSPLTSQAVLSLEQPVRPLVMNDVDAALLLSMSAHTLRKMRVTGRGPAYCKLGKNVRYRLTDLQAYIEKQQVAR